MEAKNCEVQNLASDLRFYVRLDAMEGDVLVEEVRALVSRVGLQIL